MDEHIITENGHGHVYPRQDGMKARCGGPVLCPVCAEDAAKKALERDGKQ